MSEHNLLETAKLRVCYIFSSLKEAFTPRWVRVNTLRTTFDNFIKIIDALPLKPVPNLAALEEQRLVYRVDSNIPNLLAFHPSYPLTTTFAQEYASGQIILQDKASCIPAHLLDVRTGQYVLDACAAPGNKTTQLAAAIGPTGHVIGVEKDPKRVETLKKMVEKAGASDCNSLGFPSLI
jgi:25S rRNA (cytosine2278-C5)-methyltransferase